jgi:hypothetical protein
MTNVLDDVPDEGRMWTELDAAFALAETFGELPTRRDEDRVVEMDDEYRDEAA